MNELERVIARAQLFAQHFATEHSADKIAQTPVTAGQIGAVTASLADFFSGMSQALAQHQDLVAGEYTAEEVLKVAAMFNVGAPFTTIASLLLPFLLQGINDFPHALSVWKPMDEAAFRSQILDQGFGARVVQAQRG